MKMFLPLALVLAGLTAQAASEVNLTKAQITSEEATNVAPAGWMPFLGLDLGYSQYKNNIDVEGIPSSLKVLGSYYTESSKGVFDLGLGIANQQFSQTWGPAKATTGNALEAAARYQWSNRWQAGVVFNTFFNKGDIYGSNQADAQFAGVQVLKEMNISGAWIARVGGRLMNDVNTSDKDLQMALIDLQVGWNPAAKKQSAHIVNTAAAQPAPSLVAGIISAELKKGDLLRFDLNSAAINVQKQARLEKLASVLSQNSQLFEKVQILGYADPSGMKEKNQVLSQNRAQTVAKILNKKVKGDRIVVVGKGDTSAFSNELAPNRRVELIFTGVKDQAQLEKALSTVQ